MKNITIFYLKIFHILSVCSKMADEPVADRKREVWRREFCWWCLSSGFPLRTFLLGFADSFCFVFTSILSYEASPLCSILRNLFPRLCWYVEVLKGGFEGVFLLLTTMGAFSHLYFFIEDFFWQTFIRQSGNMACLSELCQFEKSMYTLHPCACQDFCAWNPVLPLDLKKFSKTACMEVVQSFDMPWINCPSFACV